MGSPKSPYKELKVSARAFPKRAKQPKAMAVGSTALARLRKKNRRRCGFCMGGRTTRRSPHGWIEAVVCWHCSGTGLRGKSK